MNMEFTSIKDIASEIYEHPLMRDLPFERIIRDTLELMQITGSPNLFEDKEAVLDLDKYRAMLPCDYYDMNQVILEPLNKDDHRTHAFKYTTATFSPVGARSGSDLVYRIQGNVIYTSVKEGPIRISYKAIKLDDEGYPVIINNASYKRALKSYIKKNWFTILFDEGRIRGDILQNAQLDYDFNISQAQNSLIMPTLDQMESISRIYNDLLIRPYEHNGTFNDINKSHILRVH